jgi:hypothetical protein
MIIDSVNQLQNSLIFAKVYKNNALDTDFDLFLKLLYFLSFAIFEILKEI